MKPTRTLSSASFLVLALLGTFFNTGTAIGKDSKARLSSWDNLQSLTPGQEIRVITNNFKAYQGAFESFTDGGITLQHAARKYSLARQDILRVSQEIGHDHRGRNALIGMAVGAGAGLAIGLTANHVIWSHVNCDEGPQFGCSGPPNPHWGIILTPLGGVGGAIIGGLIPTGGWRDVYRARSRLTGHDHGPDDF